MLVRPTKLALALSLTALAFACASSSSSTSPDYAGSCSTLASKCHATFTALGKECHDLGHDGVDATCGPRVSECLAECAHDDGATDAGPSGDAGTASATADGGASAACVAYCTCMTATCGARPTYPYLSEAACLTTCANFTAAGLTCVSAACLTAPFSSNELVPGTPL